MSPARVLVVSACLVFASCDDPLGTCVAEVSLVGAWRYEALPGPSHPYLTQGTLTVTGESCEGFDGRADLLETDELGVVRARVGSVSGRVLDSGSLRFDVFLEAGARQHFGELRADSMVGSFVDDNGSGGGLVTGEFTGSRRSTS